MAVVTYGARALQIALGQVGVKETPAGSNSGPQVRAYQACTTLGGTGWPWCAAFFNWAYKNAGAAQPYRSASVPELYGWYHAHGRIVDPKHVRPGDAVAYDWNGDRTPDHIGLFRRWMNTAHTEFEAVEGNTALGNDSNGGEVMIRLRYTSNVLAFMRPVGSQLAVGTKFDPTTGRVLTRPKRAVARVKRAAKKLPYLGRH